MGTKNFAIEAAMTMEQCHQALSHGAELIEKAKKEGSNVFGFGEMGIGNTTAASALFSAYSGKPAKETTGSGTGLDNKGIAHKAEVIQKAIEKHGDIKDPMQVLATFGGFEIAMICGAMLKAAELKSTILVDGFIVTSALIAASQINPNVLDYCIFSHQSNEQGHKLMLNFLNAEPLLHLDLRLGEGTGAAVALPILQSAVNFLNEMSSFEDAGVSNKE